MHVRQPEVAAWKRYVSSVRARFGLRRQSAAATALSDGQRVIEVEKTFGCESGVALRFPPQSKTRSAHE